MGWGILHLDGRPFQIALNSWDLVSTELIAFLALFSGESRLGTFFRKFADCLFGATCQASVRW